MDMDVVVSSGVSQELLDHSQCSSRRKGGESIRAVLFFSVVVATGNARSLSPPGSACYVGAWK